MDGDSRRGSDGVSVFAILLTVVVIQLVISDGLYWKRN